MTTLRIVVESEELVVTPYSRWEKQASEYAVRERRCMITKLALGILVAWGLEAASVFICFNENPNTATLGYVFTSVLGVTAIFLTWALYAWGRDLKEIDPIHYDADNPDVLNKIYKQLSTSPFHQIEERFDNKTNYLSGAGIVTVATAEKINSFIKQSSTLSCKRGEFHALHSNESIEQRGDLIDVQMELHQTLLTLENEWRQFQEQLIEELPISIETRPLVSSPISFSV